MSYPNLNSHESVVAWAEAWIASHPQPDFFVGPSEDHQMQRWFVVPRNETANVYLHRFLRSDDDRALHDHPFDNTSWILSGEYLEHFPDRSITRHQGEVVSRVAELSHRIELVSGPVLTLFFTGPRRREWGFHCPQGWRHWKDFVNFVEGGNQTGQGCQ